MITASHKLTEIYVVDQQTYNVPFLHRSKVLFTYKNIVQTFKL